VRVAAVSVPVRFAEIACDKDVVSETDLVKETSYEWDTVADSVSVWSSVYVLYVPETLSVKVFSVRVSVSVTVNLFVRESVSDEDNVSVSVVVKLRVPVCVGGSSVFVLVCSVRD
jgi:hypothetical protein